MGRKRKSRQDPAKTAPDVGFSLGARLPGAPHRRYASGLLVLVLVVFTCALALRLIFVLEVLQQNALVYGDLGETTQAGFLVPPDSDAYIRLAKAFFGSYFDRQAEEDALWRTPGYPAFLIPFYRLDLAPGGVLFTQAFLGALIPVLTLLLARMLTGSLLLAGVAGLLSAVSPSGVGLCGLIMNDLLMALLVIVGIFCFYVGTVSNRGMLLIVAGTVFGIGALVKPVLMFWPLVMVACWYLFLNGEIRSGNGKALAVALSIPVLIMGLWCLRNYVISGVLSPSSNINFNLHDYLRPRVEEWVKAGGMPDSRLVRRNRDETRLMVEQQARGLSIKEKLDLLKSRSMEVLRAHPLVTLQVMLQNAKEHALSGWDYFRRQLPLAGAQMKRLTAAAREESQLRELALEVVAVCFPLLFFWAWWCPTPANRRTLALTLALVLIYGYFAVFSSTAFWGGSRVMYPVEFVLILLLVMTTQAVMAVARSLLTQARLTRGSPVTRSDQRR